MRNILTRGENWVVGRPSALTAVLSTVSRLADVLQAFRSTFQGGDSVQRLVILFDYYLSVVLSNISRKQVFRQWLEENIDNIQRLVQAIVHIPQIWVRCYQLSLVLPTSAELAFRSRFKRKHTSAKSLFNFVVNWYIIECSKDPLTPKQIDVRNQKGVQRPQRCSWDQIPPFWHIKTKCKYSFERFHLPETKTM